MGTRNLTVVYLDGEPKVAQYGQWDGYPSCAGEVLADEMKKIIFENGLGRLADNVRGCRFLTLKETVERYKSIGVEEGRQWINGEEAAAFKALYPQLDRDMGYDIVDYIYENGPQELSNSFDFAANTLSCEWAYVVDLDEETFSVYCGYGKTLGDQGHFAGLDVADQVGGGLQREQLRHL